jgi:hypothetical protein
MVGPKEVICGAAVELVTAKESALVVEPLGEMTVIAPVVAPVGTETTNDVVAAAEMLAVVPLNLTVSCAGSALKLAPEIVTEVPTGPDFGWNSKMAD